MSLYGTFLGLCILTIFYMFLNGYPLGKILGFKHIHQIFQVNLDIFPIFCLLLTLITNFILFRDQP